MNSYDQIEKRIKEIGSNASQVCERAGVNRSTLTRWKQARKIGNHSTLLKIEKAIAAIEKQRQRAAERVLRKAG